MASPKRLSRSQGQWDRQPPRETQQEGNGMCRKTQKSIKDSGSWHLATRRVAGWKRRPDAEGTGPNPKRQDDNPWPERVAGPLPESPGRGAVELQDGLDGWDSPEPPSLRRQTEVCTGVTEWEGEAPRSDGDEARVATSRCRSSTLFCSSARTASSSLRFW